MSRIKKNINFTFYNLNNLICKQQTANARIFVPTRIKILAYFFGSLILLQSCINEEVDFDSNQSKAKLVNGIFHFNTPSELKTEIERIKNQDDTSNINYFKNYYSDGFNPLFPWFEPDDESSYKKFFQLKIEKLDNILKNSVDLEEDDELISDDHFASFLNNNREIVVANTLYKYTSHGVFKTHYTNLESLNDYIAVNQINDFNGPDPEIVQRGEINITDDIVLELPSFIGDTCSGSGSVSLIANQEPYNPIDNMTNSCFSSSSSGPSTGTPSNGSVNHKQSLIDYGRNLSPCDESNTGLWGWNIFGTTKKCYSYHNNDNRVKTKYWDESYIVYTSIGVKVKHQYNGWLGWRTKDTDEVALTINRAFFSASVGNSVPGTASFLNYANETNRLFYIADHVYANNNQALTSVIAPFKPDKELIPQTPFDEDIIITDFINLPLYGSIDINVEAQTINNFFWSSAWDQTRRLMLAKAGREPDKITYILTTPQKVYITYIDIGTRRLNTNKIVDRLDYDWGAKFKFVMFFNANGSISTNFDNFTNDPLNVLQKTFSKPNLTQFEGISMDFVGATRMGNTWKGSRVVYNK